MTDAMPDEPDELVGADWQRRVVARSLQSATARSVDRGMSLIRAAATVLERSDGDDITVQAVAEEAGQSLRTLYQYFSSKDDLLLAVFEEAMITYAQLIRDAIERLDDPRERLAGAMLAAMQMPELSRTGVQRALARLRLRLGEVDAELIGRAQLAMSDLVRELVEEAAASGDVSVVDVEAATFMLLSVNSSYITTEALGNDAGVRRPQMLEAVGFCIRGLGADVDERWLRAVDKRLRLPAGTRVAAPAKRPARKP
jgi:AcrR family transcriptional regulator